MDKETLIKTIPLKDTYNFNDVWGDKHIKHPLEGWYGVRLPRNNSFYVPVFDLNGRISVLCEQYKVDPKKPFGIKHYYHFYFEKEEDAVMFSSLLNPVDN